MAARPADALPWQSRLPWRLELPGLTPAAVTGLADAAGFVNALAGLADRLPTAQPRARADRARVAKLERGLEDELVRLVLDHFGEASVLAEEHYAEHGRFAHTGPAGTDGLWFAVDPLDGSAAYTAGEDTYTVSVAGCLGRRAVFGFVYQPSTGSLYTAAAGGGAYRDGRPLTAELPAASRQVALGNGVLTDPAANARLDELRRRDYGFEHMACTSLKFCRLADRTLAGLVKQLLERDGVLRVWGMAAGQLIASEAGLDCVGPDRLPWRWTAGTIAAGDRQFLSDLFPGSGLD